MDTVNDLILQAEMVCATYPKTNEDLRGLCEQLTQCHARCVQFAGDAGDTSTPMISRFSQLCALLVTQAESLRRTSEAIDARLVNRSLEEIQATLSDLKICILHSSRQRNS